MLLFKAECVPMILSRKKTQTRRLWKKPRVKVGSIQKCYSGGLPISKCKVCEGYGYQTPKCRACNGTGLLQPFARVKILRVWQEYLTSISEDDAHAEGYESSKVYLDAFCHINHIESAKLAMLVYDPTVYALEFKLVLGEGDNAIEN